MFVIELGFPTGRCYGACGDAPDLPEWPPHPSRLFAALVASACVGRDVLSDGAKTALQWLERLGPPHIEAPPADLAPAPVSYVPPGDLNRQGGKVEHPFERVRKDRFFPVAFIRGEPIVRYGWETQPPKAILQTLDELAAGVTHVGTSHSMVVARATWSEMGAASHVPEAGGSDFMRCPAPGRMEELISLYGRKKPAIRRPPSPYEPLVGYRVAGSGHLCPNPHFDSMLMMRFHGISYGIESAQMLARAVRRAVMSRIADPIPAAVHGHGEAPHVAWLSLCHADHQSADGKVMGMAVAIPRSMEAGEREALATALGKLVHTGVRLDDGRDAVLRTLPFDIPVPKTLQEATWTTPSRRWVTVSPVVPDRLPRRNSERFVVDSVVDSLNRAGYPTPEHIEVSRYSWLKGIPGSGGFPSKLPRFHACVTFPSAVRGPVIAGRLRHFGVGLFRPWGGS